MKITIVQNGMRTTHPDYRAMIDNNGLIAIIRVDEVRKYTRQGFRLL